MDDRRPLEPHELAILVFGALSGVVIAVGAVWFLLRTAIIDELDPIGLPIVLGVLIGSLTGVALIAAARRARL